MSEQTHVVIVHGLWMTGVETFLLQRHLEAQTQWPTVGFSYASVKDSLEVTVGKLAQFIDALPPGNVHIVAHSLGGIITHSLAHTIGLTRPGRAVLLCSPIQGSRSAARLANLPLGRRILGKTACDTLLEPAHRTWSASTQAGVLAGTRSMGFGRLLGGINEPNDGTVRLAETELPGATDSVALAVSHSSVLFSPRAASQAAFFLSHGRFRRKP